MNAGTAPAAPPHPTAAPPPGVLSPGPRAVRLALAVLSATLMVLSVPTFDLWPLMWIALVPAIHLAVTAPTGRRAFLEGWLTGAVATTGGFYWIEGLLERFGHMPLVEAVPIMMLLNVYQGLEFALFSWVVHRLGRPGERPIPLVLLAPTAMAGIELVVPQIFPFYLAISQAWQPAIIQIADLTGPVGVTFLLLLANAGIYEAVRAFARGPRATGLSAAPPGKRPRAITLAHRGLRPLLVPAMALLAALAYGAVRIHQIDARWAAAPKARVGIVQANVGIQEKWDPSHAARLLMLHQRESAALAQRGADLVVWPESSYPYALSRTLEHDFPETDPRRVQRGFSTPLVFGSVTLAPGPRELHAGKDRFPYNTALMLNKDGRVVGLFDKVYLLLFGEYIPFYDHIPWFTKLFPEASNFSRGEQPTVFPFEHRGRTYRLGPLICYEDILPAFTRSVARLDPNLLVNITNDAWFGKTSEPYQHLALAVFRSVENRLDMVRAVNTGVSAHIDAAGRVRIATESADPDDRPPPQPVSALAEVALLERGGIYARVGDVFGFLCLVGLAAMAAARARARSV